MLRFETGEGAIRRLTWCCFSPEVLHEVAGLLGEPARDNGYRYRVGD